MSRHGDRRGQIADFRDSFETINWLYLLFKCGVKTKSHFEWHLWLWSSLGQLNLEPTRPNGLVGCKVPTDLVKISVKEATHMGFHYKTKPENTFLALSGPRNVLCRFALFCFVSCGQDWTRYVFNVCILQVEIFYNIWRGCFTYMYARNMVAVNIGFENNGFLFKFKKNPDTMRQSKTMRDIDEVYPVFKVIASAFIMPAEDWSVCL